MASKKYFVLGSLVGAGVGVYFAVRSEKARHLCEQAADKAVDGLEHARLTVEMIQKRTQEIDRLLEDTIRAARERSGKFDSVLNNILSKLDETVTVIRDSTVRCADEVAALFGEVRANVNQLLAQKDRAA